MNDRVLRRRLLFVLLGITLVAGCGSTNRTAPVLDRTPAPEVTTPVESRTTDTPRVAQKKQPVANATSTSKATPVAKAKTQPVAKSASAAVPRDVQPYREGDWRPEYHIVRKGDTLYSIALDYGQDYRDLASWNHLADASYIQVGQRLRLFPADGEQASSATAGVAMPPARAPDTGNQRPVNVSAPTFSDPKTYRAAYSDQAYSDLQRVLAGEVETAVVTTAIAKPQPTPPTTPSQPVAALPSRTQPQPAATTGGSAADERLTWEWPAPGKLLYSFSEGPIKKGVGISGKPGQSIVSSAPGKVVYSGSGLRGYGNLIIVKHNATYLSVYALNQQLLVKEGQMVAQGQKIAVMGESLGQPALHFEIRRLGQPIDPLKFLPDHPS